MLTKQDLGSSHGGVRGTLAHMVGAEWIWLERWKGISPPRLPDEGEYADLLREASAAPLERLARSTLRRRP